MSVRAEVRDICRSSVLREVAAVVLTRYQEKRKVWVCR